MSWSLQSTGKAADVAPHIASQVENVHPSETKEMETVGLVGGLIAQALSTFDPEKPVRVVAQGHMGFADWASKVKPFQHVSITIEPIHFDVSI